MKIIIKNLFIILLAVFVFAPDMALAHQPRIVTGNSVKIANPEVSQAFYGELRGAPAEYQIASDREFRLYVGILVPDLPAARKDISAEIYRVKNGGKEIVALLDGSRFKWTPFYEEYGKDNYFWGPEYKADVSQKGVVIAGRQVPGGEYRIRVFSPANRGRYALAIGDIEAFPPKEIVGALLIMPRLKIKFFNEPLLKVILSPFVLAYILICYLVGFIGGVLLRAILKIAAGNSPRGLGRNIGITDRVFRLTISVLLSVWAIATTWNPILFILSGFTLFEAIFSWCGFYAALGKNTCLVR